MRDSVRDLIGRYPIVVLLSLFLVSVIVILLAEKIPEGYLRAFVETIAFAIASASVIGAILDVGFRTRIARDVFDVAFGYLLPPRIREETRWVTGLELIATHTTHEFHLKKHPDTPDMIILDESVTREIENVTNRRIEFLPLMGVQEWFHPVGPSEIISFEYHHFKNNEEIGSGVLKDGAKEDNVLEDGYIHHVEAEKTLKILPDEKVTVTWRASQIRHKSDATYAHTATAILKPRIKVRVDPELKLDFAVKFMSRHQAELQKIGEGEYVLPALLLPSQAVRVRWWDKEAKDTWERNTENFSATEAENL